MIPGGVNTSLRSVEPQLIFTKAQGAYVWDIDGNRYIDYHTAFSPIPLGYLHPPVIEHVRKTKEVLDLFGVGNTELEIKLAEKIAQHIPCAEKVAICNSGSEATHTAVRISRAVTGQGVSWPSKTMPVET